MHNSFPSPSDYPMMAFVGGFLILGFTLMKFFGNVKRNENRRLLQNFVYRLYQIHVWFLSLIRAFDAGVGQYYTNMDSSKITPLNEKRYKPELVQERKPIIEKAIPKTRRVWDWRRVVGE